MKIKVKNESLIYILCIAVLPLLCSIMPIAGAVLTYLAILILIWQNNYYTALFFILFSIVQNIILIIGANRFSPTITTLFSLSKEIMIYGCVVIGLLRSRGMKKSLLYFIAFLIIIIIGFSTSSASTYAKVVSIRQLLLPFICLIFGSQINLNSVGLEKLIKIIIKSAIIIGVIGILELVVFKDSIWKMLPVYQYQVNKGTTYEFYMGVPLNYYTWDYYDLIHRVVRRLVSVFADPLITGHYLFLGFVLSDAVLPYGKKQIFTKCFLAISALLTLSKGVYISFAVYILMKIIRGKSYKDIVIYIFSVIIGISIISILLYHITTVYLPTSSIGVHFKGLVDGFKDLSFLGNGLGNAGGITGILNDTDSSSLSSESYVGVLTAQIGLIGLLVYIIYFMTNMFLNLRRYKAENITVFFSATVLLFSVLLESILSESSISILGTGLYFLLAGIANNKHIYNQNAITQINIRTLKG